MKMHAALKRGLALFLTLAMMVSIVYQGGYMRAHAENEVPSKGIGQLFVENYDELSDAEKALYGSGLLAGDSYGYVAPTDAEFVSVDTESKTITADNYADSEGNLWTIDRADIVVGEEVKESVDFTGNTAAYTYDGNAFSVKVYYALTLSDMEDEIEKQIDIAVALKDGLAAGQTVVDQEGNLYTLEVAMPELVELASTGVDLTYGGQVLKNVGLNAEAKAAIAALNGQMDENGGKLDLSVIRSAYAAAPSKVNYILTQGEGMLTCVEETQTYVAAIDADLQTLIANVDSFVSVGMVDQATADSISLLAKKVADLNAALQTVMAANWNAAEQGAALVKAGISAEEYIELDSLLNAVEDFTPGIVIEDTLFVTESYIQYNLSMFNVDVTVVLKAANGPVADDTLYEVSKYVADTATLSEGASADEISDVVAAAVIAAKANWASEYLTGDYVEKASIDFPGALVEDLEYTIIFEPVDCLVELTYGETSAHQYLPYGYKMPLATYYGVEGATDKVYDYTVNGKWYPEGSVITIEGATAISREVGEPYAALSLYELIAEQYCANDPVAAAILTSGALKGDVQMGIRKPVLADLVTVVEGADSVTVTAEPYYAGDATGLTWVPDVCTVITGDDEEVIPFVKPVVSFDNMDYDRVEVSYKLDLSSICSDSAVLEILNLPAMLTDEADAQTSALATLVAKMGDMEQLTGAMMAALKGMIAETRLNEDPAEDARLKALFTAQVETIQKTCMQSDSEAAANSNIKYLYLLKQMQVYTDANNGGLDYYYENADAIIKQVALLGDSLSAMLAGPNEKAALGILLSAANYGKYAEKIEDMAGMLADVKADLTLPNADIDVTSAALEKLTDALAGSANSYTTLSGSLCLEDAYSVNSSKTVSLSVSFVIDGKTYSTGAITMMKVDTVTEAQINAIKAEIEAKVAAVLGNNAAYYNNTYDASALSAVAGMTGAEAVAALAGIVPDWSAKTYTVVVEGMADQTITIIERGVTLPASGNADVRYDYIVDGQTVNAGKYTFTADQLDRLFENGRYNVTLVEVDVARENLISFVDSLNEGTGNAGITFALVENMGKYSIVMKVDTADMGALQNAAMGMVMTMANYDYIGIGGEGLKFVDENGAAKFSIQSVVDAVMNSGMTGDDLVDAVKSDDMSKLQIVGSIISDYDMAQYGGKLAVSTMEIANAESSYPLYITIGSVHDKLDQVVGMYSEPLGEGIPALKNYVQFVCSDGAANISVTLPDKAYQAYLAALLLTGNIALDNIAVTDIDTKIAYEFLKDLVPALEDENVTLDSWLNTLVMMGVIDSTNISNKNILAQVYDALCGIWGGVDFVNDDLASASGNLPIKSFVDGMAGDYAELLGMVVEYNTGLNVAATVTLANSNTYNAIYVDSAAQGAINKVGMTTISGEKTYEGYTVLVLTDDVDANITFNGDTLLNLNGHTLGGSVAFNGRTFVVDTSTANTGAITADVTGSYYQNDACYSLVQDENGNVTVVLDADAVVSNSWGINSAVTLALDVLADMIFNGYVNGSLYVDGNMIYDIELADGIALYLSENTASEVVKTASDWVSNVELSKVLDAIVDALTDFDTMAEVAWVDNQKVLASFGIATDSWNITFDGAENGDYVTVNVGGAEEKAYTLTFAVAAQGTQSAVQKALDVLADTVTIKADIVGTQSAAGKTLALGWETSACVNVDLTSNAAYAKAVCAILACGNSEMEAAVKSGDMTAMQKAFNAITVTEAVEAVMNYDIDTVKTLSGISNEAILALGQQLSVTVNLIDPEVESTRTLGSFYKTDLVCGCGQTHSGYGATRSDWSRNADGTVKGFTLDATVSVDYVTVMINIWDESEPDTPDVPEEPVWGTNSGEIVTDDSIVSWNSTYNSNWFNDFALVASDRNDWGFGVFAFRNASYSTGALKYAVYTAEGYANGGEPYKKATNMALNSAGTCLGTITTQQWPDGDYVVVDSEGNIIAKFSISTKYIWATNSGEIANGCYTVSWNSRFNSNWFNDFALVASDRNDWGFGVFAFRNASYSTGALKYTVYTAEAFANGGEPYKKATNMALNSAGTCLGTITTQQWPDGDYVVVDSEGNAIAMFSIATAPAHNIVHVEAKAPTCYEEGNVEYWYCEDCGYAWLDKDLTQVTNLKSVILPVTHVNLVHVPAKAATCFEDGNIEYWYCTDCGYAWLDEYCHLNTNLKAVILPAGHASIVHVEAKAPTCYEEGNVEYWYCEDCGYAWLDEDLTQVTNLKSVILPVTHVNLVHVPAKAATCFEDGNIEYWYCTECGFAWLDEYLHLNTNLKAVILPASHASIIHVAAKAPTCTEEGNIEYWYCVECGYAWLDEDLHLNTNLLAVKLAPVGHKAGDPVEENRVEATDTTDGSFDSVIYCENCGAELDRVTIVLPATGEEPKPSEPGKTGDEAPVVLMTGLMVAAAAGFIGLLLLKKRERN